MSSSWWNILTTRCRLSRSSHCCSPVVHLPSEKRPRRRITLRNGERDVQSNPVDVSQVEIIAIILVWSQACSRFSTLGEKLQNLLGEIRNACHDGLNRILCEEFVGCMIYLYI